MSQQRHMDIVKLRSRVRFMQSKQRFMTQLIGKRGMYASTSAQAAAGEETAPEPELERIPDAVSQGQGDNSQAAAETGTAPASS
jgi:hypothetical protein